MHGDVRRMLLNARANNEASRAFAVYVGQQLDITKYSTDTEAVRKANDRVALLTPIAKAYLTDKALDTCLEAQMVFGGHGYIREWGMEQCIRDLRISQIYEGTNGVQAQDLIGRKTIRCGGAYIAEYIAEIREFAQDMDDALSIKATVLDVSKQVEEITQFILEQAKQSPDFSNAVAVDYLHAVGLLSFVYMYARISQAAQAKDESFFQHKLILAQYYASKVLPDLAARLQRIQAGADLMMQLPEEYFTTQS